MSSNEWKQGFPTLCILLTVVLIHACGSGAFSFQIVRDVKPTEPGAPAYVYVPFDVPSGTESLAVGLSYDKKGGKNQLELGIFDETFSGEHSDKQGFRGWSGSVRDGFFISREAATHGYVNGPVNAGKWYLILGLASVEEAGVEVTLDFTLNDPDNDYARAYEKEKAKEFKIKEIETASEAKWFKGDLHAHTFHSDGKWSVKALLDSAKARGLDFISLTDHNTYSHHGEIDALERSYDKLLVLKGEEVTTHGGHINVWGLGSGEWVDFRVTAKTPDTAIKISGEAKKAGAIASVNHPTMDCTGCTWTYGNWGILDSVEIWNAKWDAEDEAALKIWDGLLQDGNRITAVGSSDTHQPLAVPSEYGNNLPPGSPTVFVAANALSKENLLQGIKDGYVYVTADPAKKIRFGTKKGTSIGETEGVVRGSSATFNVSLEGFGKNSTLRLISKFGNSPQNVSEKRLSSGADSFERSLAVDGPGYARIEVRNADGSMAAFTNPIWVKVG